VSRRVSLRRLARRSDDRRAVHGVGDHLRDHADDSGRSITLGTFFSGLVARIIRSSLLEVLDKDYIKAARARGVWQAALVYRHAFANALIPVVTVIGLQFGALLGGAVLTETVFGIPGLGRLTVAAILNRDYAVVQGAILIGVFAVVVVNLVVDLTYGFLDPRIRVA
jgi:peptide/nickel transport system permease protein